MAHSLEHKIAAVRRRVRRVLRWYAMGWTIAAVATTVVAASALDFAVHVQDSGLRWMASLSVAAIGVGTALWLIRAVRRVPLTDLALARSIERQHPELTDRVSSALEFLRQAESDLTAGSPALRRAVIHQVVAETDQVNFGEVVNAAPARWALASAGGIVLLIGAIALVRPALATTAAVRLFMPWSQRAWPKVHSLVLREAPARLAVGEPFEVEAYDATGRLPDEVRIHYRFDDDGPVEIEAMQRVSDVVVARKEAVVRSFWYRVEGGDDQTGLWQRLDVVAPPQLEQLNLVVHPPSYTGLPPVAVDRDFQALRGSVVEIRGRANKRLAEAALLVASGSKPDSLPSSMPLRIGDDRKSFFLSVDGDDRLEVRETAQYWLRVVDESQISSSQRDRFEMRALADAPPTVSIEQPSDDMYVTPAAATPIGVFARDDLALARVQLSFQQATVDHSESATSADARQIEIWSGPADRAPDAADDSAASVRLDYVWDLAPLGLTPHTTLVYQAIASDYLPQSGESARRRLHVVSVPELENRVAQRLGQLLSELRRGETSQQEVRQQTAELEIAWRESGRWSHADLDQAQATAHAQRQAAKLLASEQESVQRLGVEILGTLSVNRLDLPEIEQEVATILAELSRLERERFAPIDQQFTAVIKSAQSLDASDAAAPARVAAALAELQDHEQAVLASLERMIESLARWDDFRRFAREVAALRRDQAELREQTNRLVDTTLGQEPQEIDAATQIEIKQAVSRQTAIAARVDQARQQMTAGSQRLAEQSPPAAASLADAAERIGSLQIGATMRAAAEQAANNRLTLAVERQQQAIADLDDVLNVLGQRRELELVRRIKQLRQAEQALSELKGEQVQLEREAGRLGDAAPATRRELARLAVQQHAAQQRAERVARQLERLQSGAAEQAAQRAAEQMRESGDAGQQGDAPHTARAANSAAASLDEAQRRAEALRRQLETELASEQVAKLESWIAGLRSRQARLIDDTQSFNAARAGAAELNRDELLQLAELAADQRLLQNELVSLSRDLQPASVFRLAIDSAAREMGVAADGLDRRQTDGTVQAAERAALRRLEQMATAFHREPRPSQPAQPPGATGGQKPASPQQAKQAQRNLAEVKLLRALQADLHDRYRELADSPQFGAEQQQQLADLAREQGRLGKLTLQWVERQAPVEEEAPFPELRLEPRSNDADHEPPHDSNKGP